MAHIITANEIKTKGASILHEATSDDPEVIVS